MAGDAVAGDPDALEQLFWLHHDRLLGHLRRKVGIDWQGKIKPEDILQQACIDVFQNIAGFAYQGDDSF